jgi:hypothetical protein
MSTTKRTRRLFGGSGAVHSARGCSCPDRSLAIFTDGISPETKMPRVSWSETAKCEVILPPADTAADFNAMNRTLTDRMRAELTRGPNTEFAAQIAPWSLVNRDIPVRLNADCVPTVSAVESMLRGSLDA